MPSPHLVEIHFSFGTANVADIPRLDLVKQDAEGFFDPTKQAKNIYVQEGTLVQVSFANQMQNLVARRKRHLDALVEHYFLMLKRKEGTSFPLGAIRQHLLAVNSFRKPIAGSGTGIHIGKYYVYVLQMLDDLSR